VVIPYRRVKRRVKIKKKRRGVLAGLEVGRRDSILGAAIDEMSGKNSFLQGAISWRHWI
jgi:hypothetical protein